MEGLDIQTLNTIPPGYKNNLIWNFGHIVVTQQLLCYKLSGLEMAISDEMVDAYRKGSTPVADITEAEYITLKHLSMSLIDRMEQDFREGLFKSYSPYTTSYGVSLNNIEEAIEFNAMHESMHLGYTMALKRALLRTAQI